MSGDGIESGFGWKIDEIVNFEVIFKNLLSY